MMALVRGVDAIAHFGGQSLESTFDTICHANIQGAFNLYEAARKHGVKRIVYASSSQVTGFYPTDVIVDPSMPVRRRASTACRRRSARNLSRLFYDRYGIETVCLRIAMAFPEPTTHRMLRVVPVVPRSLIELVKRGLAREGCRPHDRLRRFRQPRHAVAQSERGEDRLDAARQLRAVPRRRRGAPARPDPDDVQNRYHGGKFTQDGRSRIAARDARAALEVVAPTRERGRRVAACGMRRGCRVLDRHSREARCTGSTCRAARHTRYDVPEMVGCLALADDGGLIAATRRGVARLGDEATGALEPRRRRRVSARRHARERRRCDRQGRFWFGTMLMDMAARNRSAGSTATPARAGSTAADRRLIVQNGLAFSPDGRTMYLSDSHCERAPACGRSISTRRRRAVEPPAVRRHERASGSPDGAAVDAEGAYWTCGNDGGCDPPFLAPTENASQATRCRCRSRRWRRSAAPTSSGFRDSIRRRAPRDADEPLAGSLLAFRPGVNGVPETPYATH
jgi:hypothetical protein